jgi:hypothetical protein
MSAIAFALCAGTAFLHARTSNSLDGSSACRPRHRGHANTRTTATLLVCTLYLTLSYRLFFPLRHYKEKRMRRRARPKQSDLFESPAEISVLLRPHMRAEVASLVCALLMEVASQEQSETTTQEGSKHEQDHA